ncbi:hypothetical protein AAYR18_05805 [Leuconostoc fallax]|uniref:hypothetical protein n=1 Tax=Leuconostoc fallax TaxID=1251 RepID=UPI0020917C38|nr:hypothetical protein [Leuconostoc fallax]MCO6184202.1 hypothetical protein [Leuconostoc fallax]
MSKRIAISVILDNLKALLGKYLGVQIFDKAIMHLSLSEPISDGAISSENALKIMDFVRSQAQIPKSKLILVDKFRHTIIESA